MGSHPRSVFLPSHHWYHVPLKTLALSSPHLSLSVRQSSEIVSSPLMYGKITGEAKTTAPSLNFSRQGFQFQTLAFRTSTSPCLRTPILQNSLNGCFRLILLSDTLLLLWVDIPVFIGVFHSLLPFMAWRDDSIFSWLCRLQLD